MALISPVAHKAPLTRGSATPLKSHHRLSLPYALSSILAMLLLVASAAGLLVPGLYRDAPLWAAQARGTDLITLTVAVPSLMVSLILAARGSLWAMVVWPGVLGYTIYMYAIFAFTTAFNSLFLVYVAAFSLAISSLVALLVRVNANGLRIHVAPRMPVRPIAIYLFVVAGLFALAWMREIIPATVANTTPASLNGTNLPTNPVHVLDLSVLLPLVVLSGIWLWQGHNRGYLLSGAVLTTMTIVGMSVIAGIVFEAATDPTIALTPLPMLAVVTLIGLWLLVAYLRNVRQGPDAEDT